MHHSQKLLIIKLPTSVLKFNDGRFFRKPSGLAVKLLSNLVGGVLSSFSRFSNIPEDKLVVSLALQLLLLIRVMHVKQTNTKATVFLVRISFSISH